MKTLKNLLLLFLFAGLITACHSSATFENYQNIQNEIWCNRDTADFQIAIPDSGKYTVTLLLRHTTDYEMANLWCFLQAGTADSVLLKDTVNIKIAEPDGRWIGKGSSIKSLEQIINYPEVTFPAGMIRIQIEQAMRAECMKGIKDVGIKICPVSHEK